MLVGMGTGGLLLANPIIVLLKQCLPNAALVDPSQADDTYLWRIGNNTPTSSFSSAQTWRFLNPPGVEVSWHDGVWY